MSARPNFVLVGGIGRSGTSILAKTLASTKNSEFFYEPPVFMHFLETLDSINKSYDWSGFLKTLLINDLMKGALSGRALNLNRHDISSVYNYKNENEIKERFSSSFRQVDLEKRLMSSSGIIKVLDAIYRFDSLQKINPIFKAVIIIRSPMDVAKSILDKGWFSESNLNASAAAPLRTMNIDSNFRFPLFLNKHEYSSWRRSTELERVITYCLFHLNEFLKLVEKPNVYFIDYSSFVAEPKPTFDRLIGQLDLENGPKTAEILKSISSKTNHDMCFQEKFISCSGGPEVLKVYDYLFKKL
jgi:hypothetical protein